MGPRDRLHDREPEPVAGTGRVAVVEDLLPGLGLDSRPVVRDVEAVGRRSDLDGDGAVGVFDAVAKQVLEDTLDTLGVGLDLGVF